MKTITDIKTELLSNKKISDLVFILWAGGAALLSYSLVYALRKPFTAASFDGLDAFGLDYKVLVTNSQWFFLKRHSYFHIKKETAISRFLFADFLKFLYHPVNRF